MGTAMDKSWAEILRALISLFTHEISKWSFFLFMGGEGAGIFTGVCDISYVS